MDKPVWQEEGFVVGALGGLLAGAGLVLLLGVGPLERERDVAQLELERVRVRLEEARSLCKVKEARFDL